MRLYLTISGLTGTILTSIALIVLLFGTRQFERLEPWELNVFDIMMQLRPSLPPDPRLLVVEVTENDIQSLEQWPMTDALMHQLLSQLKQHQPTVVGLDMYRDIPIPPGNSQLTQLFKNSDNIIPICRLGNETSRGTPPPEGVSQDQVGFADLAIDEGGVVRRALLFHNADIPEGCTTRFSFNFQLARYYLEQKGIEPQTIQQNGKEYLKWGDIVFKPLSPTSGGYQQADTGGYQILLNYRTGQKLADSVTLTDVFEDRVDPSLVKDRIVLIGVSDPAENDLFSTPYSSQGEVLQKMPGVVVHGHIVSQLLSTVLDGRPLLGFWSEWEEILWILGWALVGGSLTWKIRHPLVLGLSTIGALIVVFGIGFFIFTQYGWIPVVAPAFALMSIPIVNISLRLLEFILNILIHAWLTEFF
ncbi:CHASE2 domain-containing protein [Coleofasciculus chthonoplastes]|nr:CHASE2 domain-containing protein [Coleofasciculus chthonoplastes]